MMSVQRSGVLHEPRLATGLMPDPEGLSIIDNEIWLEKIHFDFSPEVNLLKARRLLFVCFCSCFFRALL
jgi:hypothetical protein